MKKIITVITSILLLNGCYHFQDNEEGVFRETKNAFAIREIQLKDKIEVELVWFLIDGRNENILLQVRLLELGFQKGKGLNQKKVALLAKQLAKGIDQPLVNPKLRRNGEIKAGKNRVILVEKELIEQMMSLAYYNKKLILPIYEEEPKVTVDDLRTIKNSLLSKYTTNFNPSVIGRSENIKLSSEAIDHYVLAPSEVFSFNKVVGERTKEKGYQEAMEIVNKEFVIGIGGGICQTSSTLFNAVDQAGLEIIERYSHSRDISYVPKKRDATVSWGGPDFKFRNPYDIPILISAETNLQTGKIEVKVYGPNLPETVIVSNE